jgi:hypothetical protein
MSAQQQEAAAGAAERHCIASKSHFYALRPPCKKQFLAKLDDMTMVNSIMHNTTTNNTNTSSYHVAR